MTIERALRKPLVSNGYPLSTSPDRLDWLIPSDPHTSIDILREQFKAQGYLWLKGILKRDNVLAFRRRFFQAMQPTGLLAPDSDPVDGIATRDSVATGDTNKILMEVVRWAAYESFCLSPEIWRFYERLLDSAVYLHKRKIIRQVQPGSKNSTGAHYDLVYLRGGTDSVCSSWIPLGDVPVEMGGLVYLEGSDALGRQMEAEFSHKNANLPPEERISAYNRNMAGWLTKDLPGLADQLDSRWLIADYEAGDMVIHSAYMIHAATDNV